jgi:hypothetical protein
VPTLQIPLILLPDLAAAPKHVTGKVHLSLQRENYKPLYLESVLPGPIAAQLESLAEEEKDSVRCPKTHMNGQTCTHGRTCPLFARTCVLSSMSCRTCSWHEHLSLLISIIMKEGSMASSFVFFFLHSPLVEEGSGVGSSSALSYLPPQVIFYLALSSHQFMGHSACPLSAMIIMQRWQNNR